MDRDAMVDVGCARIDQAIRVHRSRVGHLDAHVVDDVRQSLRVWLLERAVSDFDGTGDFGAYVYQRARWRIIDILRRDEWEYRRRIERPLSLDARIDAGNGDPLEIADHLEDPTADVESAVIGRLGLEHAAAVIYGELTPFQRDAVLRCARGDLQRHIANDWGFDESYVSIARSAARRRMAL